MNQPFIIKVKTELTAPFIEMHSIGSIFCQKDRRAHRIVVETYMHHVFTPVDGSVFCYAKRANGTIVRIPGSIVNGTAVCDLEREIYDVPGRIEIAVKSEDSAGKVTIALIEAYVKAFFSDSPSSSEINVEIITKDSDIYVDGTTLIVN